LIKVVTTCSAEGFESYGKQMAATFSRFWSREIRLIHYVEGFNYFPESDNIELRQLPQWFTAWKAKHAGNLDAHGLDYRKNRQNREYDYRRDCVKFAHKIAALTDAADERCDMLIWMDADTLAHQAVTPEWLESLFPNSKYMAWLDRERVYPECGFMMFRPDGVRHKEFMTLLRKTYESDRVFRFSETHDSFVIQQLVTRCVGDSWFERPHSLSGKARSYHHVFPYSRLGERLDHAKGARKELGRTPREEVAGRRKEDHWQ